MTGLFLCKQIRQLEHVAVSQFNVIETTLMERAGQAAFAYLKQRFPQAKRLLVYAGGGNNGGDGYVLARLAAEAGYRVAINQYKQPDELPPTAKEAAEKALQTNVSCHFMEDMSDFEADLIIDALLGIGLRGPLNEVMSAAINQMNDSHLPILAIDTPSGLNADTGAPMGACVQADATITFIGHKLGLFIHQGPDYSGDVVCDELGLEKVIHQIAPAVRTISKQIVKQAFPKRQRDSHKGNFGHVLVIGGNYGMPGAVALAAKSAYRVGAGLVTVATHPLYAEKTIDGIPEALCYGVETPADLRALIQKASVCVIGPGLGEDDWAQALFAEALTSQLPMVIDASALRLLAAHPQQDDNWLLTPHPGEAAALLGQLTAEVQGDRYQAAFNLQQQYGGNVVLKGAGSLIRTDEAQTWLCQAGNPGMASAGMGDILTGIIAGLIAQHMPLAQAAVNGVWLHARAADLAAEKDGQRGMVASDLLPFLRHLVNS